MGVAKRGTFKVVFFKLRLFSAAGFIRIAHAFYLSYWQEKVGENEQCKCTTRDVGVY